MNGGRPESKTALALTGIVKDYPGVRALSNVDLTVQRGEIHAVLGENGAGKSTLVGIAAGSIAPTQGAIELLGERLERINVDAARERGLAIVYQTPALAPSLSVTDAVLLVIPDHLRPPRRECESWITSHFGRLGLDIDVSATIGDLTQREAHLVEIGAAIVSEPRILILDEPTESLGPDETEWLFGHLAKLVEQGVAVVYITHRIPEVKAISTRLTVLRDGSVVGEGRTSEFDAETIVEMIIGRSLDASFPPKSSNVPSDRPVLLSVYDLSGAGFTDVSLHVRSGEILGLAGVEGNGQREFLRALGGLDQAEGMFSIDGAQTRLRSVRDARRHGIIYLSGDRLGEAMFPNMSLRENVAPPALNEVSAFGFVKPKAEGDVVSQAMAGLEIKAPNVEASLLSLSGGNQQKVLLARARTESRKVLLIEDPTQGVDAGARVEIYSFLRDLAEAGVAVVVLSTDSIELEGLCDRVAVFSRGHVQAVLEGDEVDERSITAAAVLSTAHQADALSASAETSGFSRLLFKGESIAAGLLILTVLLGLRTQASSDAFLSSLNTSELLAATSIVILVALAQFIVVVGGGIDLSVGAIVALGVVVMSFFADGGLSQLMLGIVLTLLAGSIVGLLNGLLATRVKMPFVIATLITSIAILGIARIIRPQPGGLASTENLDVMQASVGFLPMILVLAVAIGVVLKTVMERTAFGRSLRATGSDPFKANRMGVRVERTQLLAATLSGALSGLAGVLYYARTGIGDAIAGQTLLFASITAIVIAGVSIFGGAGSAIAVLAAALLLQTISNSLSFLGLSIAWQYWIQGAFVVLAAIAPMLLRRRSRAPVPAPEAVG